MENFYDTASEDKEMIFKKNKKRFLLKLICSCLIVFSITQVSGQERAEKHKDTLIFAVITDTHVGKNNNSEGLDAVVADLNRRKEISFVVNTGDVTDFGTVAEMEDLHHVMSDLSMPWFIVPGNHDTAWSGSAGLTFSKYFKDQKFVTEVGGYKLIGLSTGPYTRMARGYVPAHQLEWLDSIAKKTVSQPVLFFTHMPLEDHNMSNYPEVISLLKQMNATAGFNGHGHTNRIFDYGQNLKGIMTQTAQERNNELIYNLFYLTRDSLIVESIDARTGKDSIWARIPVGNRNNPRSIQEIDQLEIVGKQPVWARKDNGNILAKPATSNELFFVGNLRGEFKAFNQETGEVKWTFRGGEAILSSPAIKDERVVFGSADSIVYCLDATTGKKLWDLKTEGGVLASPVIQQGKVYVGSSDFHYRAIDLKTGQLLWKSDQFKGFPPGKPAIANGKIVFGTWEKMLYALNQKDGKKDWQWELTGRSHYYSPAMCTPFVYDDRVHIVSPDNVLRTFDLNSGTLLNEESGYKVRESIGGDPGTGKLVAKTMQDTVVVWNVKKKIPELLKAFNVGFGRDYSPSDVVFEGDLAFFGTTFGEIYAVDTKNHQLRWKSKVSEAMVNTPQILPGNKLLVTSADGGLFLFSNSHLPMEN